jgi:hypothetical protein
MNTNYIECACTDSNHVIRVTSDPEYKELCVEAQLNPYYGFFKRLWLGALYVLGVRTKSGHWDATLLNLEQNNDLLRILLTHKLTCEKEVTLTADEFLRQLLIHKLFLETESSAATKIKKAIVTLTSNPIYTDVNKLTAKKSE